MGGEGRGNRKEEGRGEGRGDKEERRADERGGERNEIQERRGDGRRAEERGGGEEMRGGLIGGMRARTQHPLTGKHLGYETGRLSQR